MRSARWTQRVAVLAAVAAAPCPLHAGTYEVGLAGISFWYEGQQNMDIDLVIAPGDTLQWLWIDGTHNVVSGFPGEGNEGALFNSGPPIGVPGTTFEFTFNDLGVFGYHCHPHEPFGMISYVTVVPAPGAVLLLAGGAACAGRRRRRPAGPIAR